MHQPLRGHPRHPKALPQAPGLRLPTGAAGECHPAPLSGLGTGHIRKVKLTTTDRCFPRSASRAPQGERKTDCSSLQPWTSRSFGICVLFVQSCLAYERSCSFQIFILLQKHESHRFTKKPHRQSRHMYFAFITVFIIQARETSFSMVQLVSPDCANPQGHGQLFLSGRLLFFVTVFVSWCFCRP